MQTIISLWGSSGTGKTTTAQLMRSGQVGLLQVPLLREVAQEGFAEVPLEQLLQLRREVLRNSAQPPILPVVQEALGEEQYLLDDTGFGADRLVAECAGQYQIIFVVMICHPWLVAARRQVRYRRSPGDRAREQTEGVLPDRALIDYTATAWADQPNVQVIYADASDYPIRECTLEEAYALFDPPEAEPVLPPILSMYQQTVWVRGRPYGNMHPQRLGWERDRIEAILPADLTDKTVLDIGASEGGFCYQALQRGALYATAVELRPMHCQFMRQVRTSCRLPMTVAELDILHAPLPPQTYHLEKHAYDVVLILNVLHHLPNPQAMLEQILGMGEEVIIEGPYGIGTEVNEPNLPPYPNSRALPPEWVRNIGAAHGFRLKAIECSSMTPGQRLIYRLERIA